jgi:uncharacterized protein YjbJ (UPF0337 family)
MNLDRLQGMWQQFGGRMQEHWGTLIDDPAAAAAGRRGRLAGRILERRGFYKQQSARQLEHFLVRNRNWLHDGDR